MSCKENFSLFDNQIPEIQTPLPFHPIPDEMKEIIRESSSVYMSGINFDILLNKFVNNLQITDIELQQLSEHQRLVLEHMKLKTKTKVKRSDQCHKLFYKKAFKYAQNQYFHRKKAKSRKMSQFYHHHFDTVAQKEGLPITSFYHPDKKTKPGLKVSFKTFNINYIRLLLRSKSFRGTVKHYHKVFPDECLKERQKKIKSFTSSIRKIINLAQNDSKILIEYLQSSQCKIPWTWGQIKQAQRIAEVELVKAEAHENEKKEQSDTPLDDIMNVRNELMCDEQREQFIEDQFDEEQQESLFAKLLR